MIQRLYFNAKVMASRSLPGYSVCLAVCGGWAGRRSAEITGFGNIQFWSFPERFVSVAQQIEPHDVPQRKNTVFESYLFALLVRTAVIADRNLVDRNAQLRDLGRDLDFYAEAAGLDNHVSNDFATQGFVAGFDICHIQIGQ